MKKFYAKKELDLLSRFVLSGLETLPTTYAEIHFFINKFLKTKENKKVLFLHLLLIHNLLSSNGHYLFLKEIEKLDHFFSQNEFPDLEPHQRMWIQLFLNKSKTKLSQTKKLNLLSNSENKLVDILSVTIGFSKLQLIANLYNSNIDAFHAELRFKNLLARIRTKYPELIIYSKNKYYLNEY